MNQILENDLKNELKENTIDNKIETKQNNFLGNILGKTINTAIDTGLRIILPNSIEDGVIDIKNSLFNDGLKEAIKSAINSAINLGKSAIGIVTGKFENVSQAYNAVKSGGLLDSTSKALDSAIKSANKNGMIKDGTAKFIKKGKNALKECISSNIEKTFMEQIEYNYKLDRTDFYIDMVGEASVLNADSFIEVPTLFVQLLVIFFTFPIFHTIGSKIGIFPYFFVPKSIKKSDWE